MSTPKVKICCIASASEAALAMRYGASAIGLVSEMPSGPGVISETLIAEIAATVPPGVGSFLLTCRGDSAAIIEQQRRCRVNTLQLCDRLEEGSYHGLRAALPGVTLVQVIHVTGEDSVEEALAVAPEVDALLLDSGKRDLPVKELGGTGRTHDWEKSRRIRAAAPVPVYLAGGLNESNVVEAIQTVRPYGLDLCNGVRTNGRLDEAKLSAFFARVRSAEAS